MRFFKTKNGMILDNCPIKVCFVKLTDLAPIQQDILLKQAAIWAKDAWQYDIPLFRKWGEHNWEVPVRRCAEILYFAIYAGQPVGMFSLRQLFEYYQFRRPLNVKSLGYVYVDARVRSLGIGKQIIKAAEKLARAQHADIITLETTKPSLNLFYRKQGYDYVCESHFAGQTLSFLAHKL